MRKCCFHSKRFIVFSYFLNQFIFVWIFFFHNFDFFIWQLLGIAITKDKLIILIFFWCFIRTYLFKYMSLLFLLINLIFYYLLILFYFFCFFVFISIINKKSLIFFFCLILLPSFIIIKFYYILFIVQETVIILNFINSIVWLIYQWSCGYFLFSPMNKS